MFDRTAHIDICMQCRARELTRLGLETRYRSTIVPTRTDIVNMPLVTVIRTSITKDLPALLRSASTTAIGMKRAHYEIVLRALIP